MTNKLFYGDNLDVLREHIADESVDLIYLDPPFNSDANYNVLFKAPAGKRSEAQIEAFKDTWTWGESAARAFDDVIRSRHTDAAVMLRAMRSILRESDLIAYLCMMAVRLIELRRVLKPTGSLYLHCDPTASHYLKIILDAVFEADKFQSEIVWQRTNARATTGRWPRLHDIILHYTKGDRFTFTPIKVKADKAKIPHTLITSEDGRKYQTFELTGPGATIDGESGKPWRGHDPSKFGRHWANSVATMEDWDAAGLIHWPGQNGFPRRRAAEPFDPDSRIVVAGDVWTDIDRINQAARERLGYPTQKPTKLLERIITASSECGQLVLDPFCGCGTTIHAAQKLGRQWIGIDITHLAISLIERRLRDAFPAIKFDVEGTPKDLDGARDLAARDKYQFQWWAVSLVDAVPQGGAKKKGADRGVDGIRWVRMGVRETDVEQVIVSVKGGDNVGSAMIRDLKGTVEREGATAGLFITLAEPTREMTREAASSSFFDTSFGRFPKIQILSIRMLLAGMKPELPPLGRGEGFRRAPRESGPKPQQSDLGV